jgi:beta-lactamase superfamily II metal-dependent hydrolase
MISLHQAAGDADFGRHKTCREAACATAQRGRLREEFFACLAVAVYTFSHMRNAADCRSQLFFRPLVGLAIFAFCLAVLPQASLAQAKGANNLLIYAIDVEGGQSTLLVDTATHASLLVDTGWPSVNSHDPDPHQQGLHQGGLPDENGRDASRIQAAMADAGITHIDHLLITHFHVDHVGGVPELVRRVPIGEFLDHGPNREDSDITRHDYAAYLKAIEGKPRRIVHPGDTIDIPGLTAIVLAADGEHIAAVPGVTPAPNPYCAADPKWELDDTENPRSAGVLIRFGKFRFLDLGDLTKAKEIRLVCPENLIGTVDLYLVDHHGMNLSNARALVDAIHPRVAIMDNGGHKAGSPEAWQTVHDSPGLEDLWMLHTAEGSDAAHNSAEALIANLKGGTDGSWIRVVASPDGGFSVTNARTGQTKDYPRK